MKPDPALLQSTDRLRLMPRTLRGSRGTGERRSADVGSGTTFADHRAYVEGDELRHVDPHLYARFDSFHVRRFEVTRHIPVTVLLDATASMEGAKLDLGRWIAAFVAHVAAAGGDRCGVARWAGSFAHATEVHRKEQIGRLTDWLAGHPARGEGFDRALAEAAGTLPARALVVVVSDFWLPGAEAALTTLADRGREVWAIRILAPEERDPHLTGDLLLVDAETGAEYPVRLDPDRIAAYRAHVADRAGAIGRACEGRGGRFLDLDAAAEPADIVLRLRGAGWIG